MFASKPEYSNRLIPLCYVQAGSNIAHSRAGRPQLFPGIVMQNYRASRFATFGVWLLGAVWWPAQTFAVPIDTLNLNFAAVNQSLWGTGPAGIFGDSISIPDPALHASVTLPRLDVDNPASAVLSFITDSLNLANPLDGLISVSVAPAATIDASLTAAYHVNSGSFNVTYPTSIKLNLPDQILPGQSFTVSASAPSASDGPSLLSQVLSGGSVVSGGGAGYALFLQENNQYVANAGFSTTFPYATADLNLNLTVSGGLNLEACAIVCISDDLNIDAQNFDTSIFHASTLDGVSVLGQNVLGYGSYDLGAGASVTVHPPILPVDGTLQANKTLAGSAAAPLVDVAIGAEQFLPLIGQALHSELGPFGYTLLSASPELSLGLFQHLTFAPTVDVTLHFSQAMLLPDGTIGNNVTFALGDSVTLTPATVNIIQNQHLDVTPTFTLHNRLYNDTGLSLTGILNLDALELDTPHVGPVIHEALQLATIELPPLFSADEGFEVNIAPITTNTISIPRPVSAQDLLLASLAGGIDPNGNAIANLLIDGIRPSFVATNVAGHVFYADGILDGAPAQQSFLLADNDVFVTNNNAPGGPSSVDVGRVFCIVCFDQASLLAQSGFASFSSGTGGLDSLFLSDLSSFPQIPTADQVRATDPAFATSVPEPDTFALFAIGMLVFVRTGVRRSR